MIYDFKILDTRENSQCVFSSKAQETIEDYKARLKEEWAKSPMFRQHCFIYGKMMAKGDLEVIGPMGEIALSLIRVVSKKFTAKELENA